MKSLFLSAIIFSISIAAFGQRRVQQKTIQEKLNEQYCTGMFKTPDGTYFDLTNETSINGYINILDWLQGRVAGLQIYYFCYYCYQEKQSGSVLNSHLLPAQFSPCQY